MASTLASVPVPDGVFPDDDGPMNEKQLKELLRSSSTSASQLFAILRQWDPTVEKYLGNIVHIMLNERSVGVNDRDAISDMSMLHFASKFATGDRVVDELIRLGANVNGPAKWTQMTPIHYAAFFNAANAIKVLAAHGADIDAACDELEGGTPLHLAAMAGAADAVVQLLDSGADVTVGDSRSRTALACAVQIGDLQQGDAIGASDRDIIIQQLTRAGKGKGATVSPPRRAAASATRRTAPSGSTTAGGGEQDEAGGDASDAAAASSSFKAPHRPSSIEAYQAIEVGHRVRISKSYQEGTVRFRGPVQFDRKSDWVGIQLDSAGGKNNGTVKGVRYFPCKPNHGIFVRAKFVEVISTDPRRGNAVGAHTPSKRPVSARGGGGGGGGGATPAKGATTPARSTVSTSLHPTPRPGSARKSNIRKETPKKGRDGFDVGTKVMVTKKGKIGTVRFIGELDMPDARGRFLGVEFREPVGTNDGSLEGRAYFKTKAQCGLFIKPERCTWRGMKVTEDMLP